MCTMKTAMNQIYQDIPYRCLLFLFIGFALLVSPSKTQEKDCGKVSVNACLRKVQTVVTLASFPFTSDKAELGRLCSNAKEGYNCSSMLSTSGCLLDRERDLFVNFKNTAEHNNFLEDFCLTGDKRRTKREYAPSYFRSDTNPRKSECLSKAGESVRCCVKKFQLEETDESDLSRTCCKFANFRRCIDFVVRNNCGEDGIKFVDKIFESRGGDELERFCQTMIGDCPPSDPAVCAGWRIGTFVEPVCAGSRIGTFVEYTMLMSLLFIMWINYL